MVHLGLSILLSFANHETLDVSEFGISPYKTLFSTYCLALWVKISADDIFKYFILYFPENKL